MKLWSVIGSRVKGWHAYGSECVGQSTFAAVLAVLVEGHLKDIKSYDLIRKIGRRTKTPAPQVAVGYSRRRRLIWPKLPSESTL
jgi:hypothetical protein